MRLINVGVFVAVGGLAVSSVQPSVECGPEELCQAVVDPDQHTHEREPGPVQTIGRRPVAVVSNNASSGLFDTVR